jgi:hypothetical protein
MMRKGIVMLIGLAVLVFALVGCAPKTEDDAASPDTAASPGVSDPAEISPSEDVSPSAEASPSADLKPDGFVMGKVTAITGDQITLETVNPPGTKTIRTDDNTGYSIAGSTKNAEFADIAVGDVITVTVNGDLALKIIDNGPNINPDPSAYISPSPSDTASPSPSA